MNMEEYCSGCKFHKHLVTILNDLKECPIANKFLYLSNTVKDECPTRQPTQKDTYTLASYPLEDAAESLNVPPIALTKMANVLQLGFGFREDVHRDTLASYKLAYITLKTALDTIKAIGGIVTFPNEKGFENE